MDVIYRKYGDYKIEQMVSKILRYYPETRNDDFKLVQLFYFEYFGATTFSQAAEIRIPYLSIIRYRQFIQSRGLYMPDENTKRVRTDRERRIRADMSASIILDMSHNRKLKKEGVI